MSTRDSIARERSIFVCYRRTDSSNITDRIYDWLERDFPEAVFRDVDAIPYGVDFRQYIREVLESCRIMLVVIGRDWLEVKSDSGERRIDESHDHVRIEIEIALARTGVLVIPLLVQDARIPSPKDLPPTIEALAYRNGPSIRRDPDFRHDMVRLIRQMRRSLEQFAAPESHPPGSSPIPDQTPAFAEVSSRSRKIKPVSNHRQQSAPESHAPPPPPTPDKISASTETGSNSK